MKKVKLISAVTALSAVVFLAGCGKEVKPTEVSDCVFPNTNTPAPGWVCDEPVPGVALSALGVAEPTKAGISFQKDMAAADGRGRLAEQMKVQVQKMVKQYLGTTGVATAETVDAASSSTVKTITNESLVGSKIMKSRTGPNGRLFVLMGLDAESVAKIAQQSARTSMNNDQALWQQFKSKQSFDEMAADIAKQKVN